MVATGEAKIELFGGKLPGLDELKKLSSYVNSSEINKLAFAKEIKSHLDNNLAAGVGLAILGRNSEAVKTLAKAGDSIEKFMYLGYAYRRMGMFDNALTAFTKAGKKRADSLMVAIEKAATLRMAGELDKAAAELEGCANFEKVSAEYHCQLGLLCDAQGDYAAATANYEISVELDPEHQQSLFRLAYAYDLRGDDEAAIDYYKQIVKTAPVYVNAALNLAVLYEDTGNCYKALDCVEAVLNSHPNHKKATLFAKDIRSSMVMVYDEEKEKRRHQQSRILGIPISDFELSVRSRNCLKKMGIFTIGDLLNTTEAELLSYKNFGETSLVEIKKILDFKGLTLGMALEGQDSGATQTGTDDDTSEELLNKSVEDMELSVRARSALANLGLKTINDLVGKTEAELLGCKNFGVTSLNEVKERLTGYGLSLRRLE
ncbi:MAG: tetratricopeptide repeat protein [Planctomycetota bacterium]|jgi:DNA-directed RNA polymerase subunit alpha